VRISLVCRTSPLLREALKAGEIDLAITTEMNVGAEADVLAVDRLVWVGARGGDAHLRRPLPVSVGGDTCAFRPVLIQALRGADLDWRMVSEISNMDAMNATVQTDLAVMASLASTVPPGLEVLPASSGLPPLPNFSIALYEPPGGFAPAAAELARFVRESFIGRRREAA
jgi:DNA-binding transcriptional LysR family regulator